MHINAQEVTFFQRLKLRLVVAERFRDCFILVQVVGPSGDVSSPTAAHGHMGARIIKKKTSTHASKKKTSRIKVAVFSPKI